MLTVGSLPDRCLRSIQMITETMHHIRKQVHQNRKTSKSTEVFPVYSELFAWWQIATS